MQCTYVTEIPIAQKNPPRYCRTVLAVLQTFFAFAKIAVKLGVTALVTAFQLAYFLRGTPRDEPIRVNLAYTLESLLNSFRKLKGKYKNYENRGLRLRCNGQTCDGLILLSASSTPIFKWFGAYVVATNEILVQGL